jgi:hypothetical protein
MQFQHIETFTHDYALKTVTDNRVEVVVKFINDYADIVTLDDIEFDAHSDTTHGVFVMIGGRMFSLYVLSITATIEFQDQVTEGRYAYIH